jgi:hypothetical protein
MALNFLSVRWHGEAFHRLGVQDVAEFKSGWCSISADGERRREGKKKRREKSPWGRRVSPGLSLPCWPFHRSQLLGAIKG